MLPQRPLLNDGPHVGRQSRSKLLSIPSFCIVWEFDSPTKPTEKSKSAVGVVRLTDVHHARGRPLHSSWDKDVHRPSLTGEYVVWHFDSPIALATKQPLVNDSFVGHPGLFNRLQVETVKSILASSARDGRRLQQDVPFGVVAMRLPHGLFDAALTKGSFSTPKSYADFVGVQVKPALAEAPEPEPCAASRGSKQAWYDRGTGWKEDLGHDRWTPLFRITLVRIAWKLQSLDDLPEICRLAAELACPDVDLSKITFPSAETIRRDVIKLDMMHSWRRRRVFAELYEKCRVAINFSADSSPQGHYDYLNIMEEFITRPSTCVPDPFDAFGGFDYSRRTKPITTIARGRGHGSTTRKMLNFAHSSLLEVGRKMFENYRSCGRGYVRDQGPAERGIGKSAYGEKASLQDVLDSLRAGEIDASDDRVKRITFLPNLMEQADNCHVFQNAIKGAFESSASWKQFLGPFRGCCKCLGDPSYKKTLLKECYSDAPPAVRRKVHEFSFEHIDWRWEYLEFSSGQMSEIFLEFKKRFRSSVFVNSGRAEDKQLWRYAQGLASKLRKNN